MLCQTVPLRGGCMAKLLTLSCPCNHGVKCGHKKRVFLHTCLRTLGFFWLTILVLKVFLFWEKGINNLLAYQKILKSRFHPLHLVYFFANMNEKWFCSQLKCLASPSPEWSLHIFGFLELSTVWTCGGEMNYQLSLRNPALLPQFFD